MRNPIFRAVATFVLTLGFVSSLPASAQIRTAPATPQARSADWPQIGFDAGHSGYNPYETILSPSTVGGLHVRWITSGDVAFPVVAKGLLYAADEAGEHLLAFDPRSGALRWQGDSTYYSPGPPAYDAGRVYTTTYGPTLYAFDAHTGTLLWSSSDCCYGFGAPTIMRGSVYVNDQSGYTFAFDEIHGRELWSVYTAQFTGGLPAAASGLVFVGPPITALNAATGKIVWTSSINSSALSAAGGVLYTTGSDGSVLALDAADGMLLWSTAIGGYGGPSPAVANGVVYAGNSLGTVTALEAATGHILWTAKVGTYPIGGPPAVANGVVYAGSDDHQLVAIDAGSGAVLWSKKLPTGVLSTIVVNGMLYATADANQSGYYSVYAFGL